MGEVRIRSLRGADVRGALEDLARLRLEVFRAWPYLYDGSMDYERWYLDAFGRAEGAMVVLAEADGRIVGAATAMPLASEHAEIRAPFEACGEDLSCIFYLAESVLEPRYRRRGIGHAFFDSREAAARAAGFDKAVFAGVVRPDDHPLRPADYWPLDSFWRKRGYAPLAGLRCSFSWRDVDQPTETMKPLQFWGRSLREET